MVDFSFKVYEPKLLVGQIVEGLRKAITSGRLKPGEKLKEMEISKSLGVSRSPVREAFRILQVEGLVDIVPRKGVYAHQITRKDVEDIYQLREMIEVFAGRLSAENMTDEDIAKLQKLWSKMKSMAKKEELKGYLMAGSDFHNRLIASSRNKRLEAIYYGLRNSINSFRYIVHRTNEPMDSSIREHQAIIEALKARDKDLVEKLSREHVRKGQEKLIKIGNFSISGGNSYGFPPPRE